MNQTVYLAIDAGTTNIKAALINGEGDLLAMVSCGTQVLTPFEDASEMDMQALWQQLCQLLQELKAKATPDAWAAIASLGISGQGEGMWPVDQNGRPVRNAILWNDNRAKSLQLHNREQIAQYCIDQHATPIYPGSFPLIMRWLKENEPQSYQDTAWVLHCKDWLNFCLTGEIATDYSDASTADIHVINKEYLHELLELLDIPEVTPKLPPLRPSTHIIGKVTPQASRQTGLPEGLPVIAGALDMAATALGAGVSHTGDGCSILGTTLSNQILIEASQVDHSDTCGSILCSVLPNRYLRVMAGLNGTCTMDWAKQILAPELSYKELDKALEELPGGSKGILYHPYIYGERAPFKDSFACGGFYGLKAHHNRLHMMRAVYEGMIYAMMDCYHHLPQVEGRIYLSGGGANSDLLCRMVANALGKQVLRSQRKELGLYGIAAVQHMALSSEAVPAWLQSSVDIFEPQPEEHEKLQKGYAYFIQLRNNATDYWRAIGEQK